MERQTRETLSSELLNRQLEHCCNCVHTQLTEDWPILPNTKVVPMLFCNWAPRHEGVLGSEGVATLILLPRHYMEESGQLHALANLLPGKEPLVSIGYEAGWAPEPVWTRW
jgi:hypothetical protein